MKETLSSTTEQEPGKSATDAYLEGLNPQLWQELSDLPTAQQDSRWLALTQRHLREFKEGKTDQAEFVSAELEFLYLNRLGAVSNPRLSPEMHQRGFIIDPKKDAGSRMERFVNYGNFTDTVKREAERHLQETSGPCQILVSGIGISGKATVRSVLSRELSERLPEQRVVSWDRDYQKIFPIPSEWQGDIQVVEDVHGLDEARDGRGNLNRFDGAEGLPGGYDMVVYVLPTAGTYRNNLLQRGLGWLRAGKIDLTAPTDKHYAGDQEQKIKQTAEEIERLLPKAQTWFREQLRVLRVLKNRGLPIAVIEPSEILKNLYGLEEKPELADKTFAEALKILSQEKNQPDSLPS